MSSSQDWYLVDKERRLNSLHAAQHRLSLEIVVHMVDSLSKDYGDSLPVDRLDSILEPVVKGKLVMH